VVIFVSLVAMQLVIYCTMDLDFRPTFGLIPFFVPWTNLRRALFEIGVVSLTGIRHMALSARRAPQNLYRTVPAFHSSDDRLG
jgi:hypothetical protein